MNSRTVRDPVLIGKVDSTCGMAPKVDFRLHMRTQEASRHKSLGKGVSAMIGRELFGHKLLTSCYKIDLVLLEAK